MDERTNGDLFWNKKPFEILDDSTVRFNEDVFDISSSLQKVFTDTSNKSLKKINDLDRVMYKLITTDLKFDNIYLKKEKLNRVDIDELNITMMIM